MRILIKNGRIVDPAQGIDEIADLLIEEGRIAAMGTGLPDADEVIDASGCIVAPGLVDMHVHLRQPGFDAKETLRTGTRAAANGGVTTVACMPNTNPAIHEASVVDWIREKAKTEAYIRVEVVGSITRDLAGKELSDLTGLFASGVVAISDDGKTTMDEGLMAEAMRLAAPAGIPLISHAEDHGLSAGGAMHQGERSAALGIPGIPSEAEWRIVQRDIRLAETTGAKLHIAHISTREGVELVRAAKAKGLPVTAEAGPHHFLLTDEAVTAAGTETKVNPPLRPEADRAAVLAAVLDGTIDAIATDHAPHDAASKAVSYEKAAFGISGIETSLALSYSSLVLDHGLPVLELFRRMALRPAEILGLESGTLKPGALADVIVFDPSSRWVIQSEHFESMGKNTPFEGEGVSGQVRDVLFNGRIIKKAGKLIC